MVRFLRAAAPAFRMFWRAAFTCFVVAMSSPPPLNADYRPPGGGNQVSSGRCLGSVLAMASTKEPPEPVKIGFSSLETVVRRAHASTRPSS
jgi:hypothetical protein